MSAGWPRTEPRVVTARCRFKGAPGQERLAAEQWAVEMKRVNLLVGERPEVAYADGVYTVGGLATTTNRLHRGPEVFFDEDAEPWDLAWCSGPARLALLRQAAVVDTDDLSARFDKLTIRAMLDPGPEVRAAVMKEILP